MLTVLCFIAMFFTIIVVHELGHFIAADLCGVAVKEFAVGMGPKLISLKGKKGTVYSLRLLPIGGFCQMLDEDGSGETDDTIKGEGFANAKIWKRMIIILMGPLMNIVLAFACYTITVNTTGVKLPIVETVNEDSPAEAAGIEEGARFKRVNGSTVYTMSETQICTLYSSGEPITIDYDLNGEDKTVVVKPEYNEEKEGYMIGLTFNGDLVLADGIVDTIKYSYYELHSMIHQMFVGIKIMFNGGIQKGDVAGPIGVYNVVREPIKVASEVSYRALIMLMLALMAMLSINIGIFNLLPIPALDGGRFMLLLIELVCRRKLPKKVETGLILVTFALLLTLSIYVTIGDTQTLLSDMGIVK